LPAFLFDRLGGLPKRELGWGILYGLGYTELYGAIMDNRLLRAHGSLAAGRRCPFILANEGGDDIPGAIHDYDPS